MFVSICLIVVVCAVELFVYCREKGKPEEDPVHKAAETNYKYDIEKYSSG